MGPVADPFRVAADLLDPPAFEHAADLETQWRQTARPKQLAPTGAWSAWLLLAGRGFGKTRTVAEWARSKALERPVRIAVVAPTYADARDTVVEGESGLLNVIPRELIEKWNRSMGELDLVNGTHFKLFSADEPERLRGPQHHYAICDELAAWRYPETWDQLMFGLRLGERPQAVIATTPKPVPLVRELVKRDDVHVTTGSTFENEANLAKAALDQMRARYEGTRLGRQELHAEILDDLEGALWTRQMIEDAHLSVGEAPAAFSRIVIGVDPSGGGGAETGIVAAGLHNGRGYVLADRSGHYTPAGWGAAVATLYDELDADRVVGEANYGGDMVENVIRQAHAKISYRAVTASRGKLLRAEPIAALYEQGKVSHVGTLPDLEDQMCSYIPGESASPDRLDAMVWALTDLMLGRSKPIMDAVSVTGQSSWRG